MFNLRQKKVIRDLNPEDIEQLVSVSGMVTRCSNIIPEIRCASLPTWQGNRPCDRDWCTWNSTVKCVSGSSFPRRQFVCQMCSCLAESAAEERRDCWRREECFVCEKCGHEEMVVSQLGHLEEPLICGNQLCRERWTMKMVHNRSTFHNKQIVKMQARPLPAHSHARVSRLLPYSREQHWLCPTMVQRRSAQE